MGSGATRAGPELRRRPHRVEKSSQCPKRLVWSEESVAAAAMAAAGVGEDQEFGIFVRDDGGRVVVGISAIVWPPVGPPAVLLAVDLTAFQDSCLGAATDLTVDSPGLLNAVAVTFRADLHGSIAHTLDPWNWPASSWATSVWFLPDAVEVGTGEVLRVHDSRRAQGTPDGLACEVVATGLIPTG